MLSKIDQFFADLPDPRQQAKINYPLEEILLCLIVGVICGAQGWESIEDVCKNKKALLKRYYPFSNGIPVHDTIARVVSSMNSKMFQECFIKWMKDAALETNNAVVAIDGKTNRGSKNRRTGMNAIHMVSAFSSANGVVLGQIQTDEKSNEITAIPHLLALLDIKGAIVTIDAMGCQKEIAKTIRTKKADYVLATKGNQGELYEFIKCFFDTCLDSNFKDVAFDHAQTVDAGHGRVETRRIWVSEQIDYLGKLKSQWKDLKSIVLIESERYARDKKTDKMKTTIERRYFITSLEANASQILNAVRSHWGIENRLHWVLDMTYKEDDVRIRRGNGAANISVVRHISLNALRLETTLKRSMKAKQFISALNDDYLTKVLDVLFDEAILDKGSSAD